MIIEQIMPLAAGMRTTWPPEVRQASAALRRPQSSTPSMRH
jgi:hypothetical protein